MRAELARIMDGAYLGSDKTPDRRRRISAMGAQGASHVRLLCGQAFWVAEKWASFARGAACQRRA